MASRRCNNGTILERQQDLGEEGVDEKGIIMREKAWKLLTTWNSKEVQRALGHDVNNEKG